MATPSWFDIFPDAKVFHLTSSVSDHSPLTLRMALNMRKRKAKRMFRFEAMWLKDQGCEEVVQKAWEDGMIGSTGSTLESCLEKCRSSLEAWNKIVFGHVGRKVAELQKRLEWLELQPSSMEINKDMKRTRSDLNIWLEKEDDIWRQRSRINWLQSGDRNTSFFHAKASARQKKNFIEGILDENEVWQEDEEKVADVMVKYYEELFTTCQPSNFQTCSKLSKQR